MNDISLSVCTHVFRWFWLQQSLANRGFRIRAFPPVCRFAYRGIWFYVSAAFSLCTHWKVKWLPLQDICCGLCCNSIQHSVFLSTAISTTPVFFGSITSAAGEGLLCVNFNCLHILIRTDKNTLNNKFIQWKRSISFSPAFLSLMGALERVYFYKVEQNIFGS